ncbi:hypothetical protein D3C87_570440 [compost metagenome]
MHLTWYCCNKKGVYRKTLNRVGVKLIFYKMKNLNLENFGVQEMDTEEINEIHGGVVPIVLGAIALGISAGIGGMAAGYHIGKAWYYLTH